MPFHGIRFSFSIVLALVLISAVPNDCFPDCMACWELKGVSIRLKDGRTMEGYVPWNDAWLWHGSSEKKFPQVIFEPRAGIKRIHVYTDLRRVQFLRKRALVALEEAATLLIEEIKTLRLKPGPHDGYAGAGSIPVVSSRIADLLQTKPVATCHGDTGMADVYWVSYNEEITAKQLDCLCKEPWMSLIDYGEDLERNNVVKLFFPYD